jgi:hypothetical protein
MSQRAICRFPAGTITFLSFNWQTTAAQNKIITTRTLVKPGHYNIQNRGKREEGVTVAPIPIGNWYRPHPC